MHNDRKQNRKITRSRMLLTGLTCISGGLFFLLSYAALEWLLGPLEMRFHPMVATLARSVFWSVVILSLAGGSFALLTDNKPGPTRQNTLGFIGAVIALLGAASYVIGSIYIIILVIEHYANFLREAVRHY